jgi:c-di-GMP-binding flagellar brake protein YcgR
MCSPRAVGVCSQAVTDRDTSKGSERRRYPRLNVQVPVELTCVGGAPLRTLTQEISLCGCYVESLYTMEKATKLSVGLSVKDHVIRCNAVIATKHPQVGNGIEFIDMAPNDRLRLSEYIAECVLARNAQSQ